MIARWTIFYTIQTNTVQANPYALNKVYFSLQEIDDRCYPGKGSEFWHQWCQLWRWIEDDTQNEKNIGHQPPFEGESCLKCTVNSSWDSTTTRWMNEIARQRTFIESSKGWNIKRNKFHETNTSIFLIARKKKLRFQMCLKFDCFVILIIKRPHHSSTNTRAHACTWDDW